jgi:hypothetical protein
MLAKITGLEPGGGAGTGSSKSGCKKCRLNHGGGIKKCPLKGLSNGEAQKRVAHFMTALGSMSSEAAAKFLKKNFTEE